MVPTDTLRFVDTPDGRRASILDASQYTENRLNRASKLLAWFLLSVLVTAVPVLVWPDGFGALAMLLAFSVVFPIAMLQLGTRYRHFRITQHGVHIRTQRVRHLGAPAAGNLPVDPIRTGADSPWLFGRPEPERTLAFTEIRGIGHSDTGIWVELDSGVEEWPLPTLRPDDIARLSNELETRWKRAMESVTDTEEQARQARRKLERVTS
jgi:hypothetical protein